MTNRHASDHMIQPHVPTFETKLTPIIRQSPKLETANEKLEFNKFICFDIAVCKILPYLDRLHDFPAFSQTCHNWNRLAQKPLS